MLTIRAAALDLDRTLLTNDKRITGYTKAALERCREKGIALIIATARPPRAIVEYEAQIRPDAVITMNGASVSLNGQEKRSAGIDRDEVKRLVRDVERLLPGRRWSLEAESGLYANFDTAEVWAGPSAPIVTVETIPEESAYKVLVSFREEGDAGILRTLLPENTYLEISEGTLGMVIRKEATKLNGVRAALDELGIRMEETAAFGDDLADIEMLKACGVGVAVSNALKEVKEAADEIALSNEEDGVARWLEERVGV